LVGLREEVQSVQLVSDSELAVSSEFSALWLVCRSNTTNQPANQYSTGSYTLVLSHHLAAIRDYEFSVHCIQLRDPSFSSLDYGHFVPLYDAAVFRQQAFIGTAVEKFIFTC
jgi:hypothetical protein